MSNALEKIIKDKIRAQGSLGSQEGSMSIADYMALCLGHPEHGYYMTRDPFGREGDFITAPEISQMFGEMIGAWIADSWIKMGAPEKFILLECGPGRGTLMADAMRATKNVSQFHEAVQLHLLEISPVLKDIQKSNLEAYEPIWHHDLSTIPTDLPIIVIGNEFLDALPMCQMIFTETGWKEKRLKIDVNDTLCIGEFEPSKDLIEALPPLLIPPTTGDQVEVSLEQRCFVSNLLKIVLSQSGIVLFIDYGFVHNMAGDTIQAVKDHAYCNMLQTPGEADITAHVNFAEISTLAMMKNMTVHGPVSQGDYLNRLGISIRGGLLSENASEMQRRDIEASIKRLTGMDKKQNNHREEMGALFKVIAFSSDSDIELAGFTGEAP